MKKNIVRIISVLIIFAAIAIAIAGYKFLYDIVVGSDLPDWLKFMILSRC